VVLLRGAFSFNQSCGELIGQLTILRLNLIHFFLDFQQEIITKADLMLCLRTQLSRM
jgi:hypothetical protein